MGRNRGERVLDLLVALATVLALSFLVRERLVPWLAERAVLDPGDRVVDPPALLDAHTGEALPSPDSIPRAPHLLFVFRSTCSACDRALAAWNRLADAGPWRVTAVGLETRATAAAYVRRGMPGARATVPADVREFANRFRIRVVPTTLLIDREGRLAARHAGPLEEPDIQALRRRTELPSVDSRERRLP